MMKKALLLVSFISVLIALGGCAQTLTRTAPKESGDSYFRPKRVYAIDVNQAWDLTLKGLNREGIPLEMANKETGLIRTEYQNRSAWERYVCDFRFSPEPQRQTFIYIRCRYEGRKEATDQFRDLTYSDPQEAMKAEEAMYRRIEPYILPFERTPRAQEELVAKGQLHPPSPPVPAPPPLKAEETSPRPGPKGQTGASIALPSKEEPTPTQGVGASPPPAMAEAKPEPSPGPARMETPSPKPEAAASLAPPASMPPRKTGIMEEPLGTYLTTIEAANARMAPSIQSKVITLLMRGERVGKLGESGNWMKVRLTSGEDAWIHSAFVREIKPPAGTPAASTPPVKGLTVPPPPSAAKAPPAMPEKTSQPATGKTGEASKKGAEGLAKNFLITKAVTKMRVQPSSTSKVVLVLKKGRKVEKLGESGAYSKVRLSWGDMGWVLTRSLEEVP